MRFKLRPLILISLFCLAGHAFAEPQFAATSDSRRTAIAAGQSAEYIAAMEALGATAEAGGNWVQASLAGASAAVAGIQLGELQRAIDYGSKALALSRKAKDSYHSASAMLIVADAYGRIGKLQQESEWAHKALALARRIKGNNRDLIQARSYQQVGEGFLRQRKNQQAIEYLSYAVTAWEARLGYLKSRASAGVTNRLAAIRFAEDSDATCLHRLGTAYLSSANPQEAAKVFERGLTLLATSGLKSAVETSLVLGSGQVYLAQQDFPHAMDTLLKALRLAEARRQTAQIQFAAGNIGAILLQSEKPAEAIPYYKEAIEAVESTRSLLESEEFRTSFFASKAQVYRGMIAAELGAREFEEAFNYSERARSRAFLDILGSKVQLGKQSELVRAEQTLQAQISGLKAGAADLRASDDEETEPGIPRSEQQLEAAQTAYADFLARVRRENKEQASLMNVEPLTLKQLQALLDPGVTMIEYFILDQQIAVWVVEKERFNFVRLSLNRNELSSKIAVLRQAIHRLGTVDNFKPISQELYRLLIQPLAPFIKGKELLIIPHDVLHYLPFQALISSQGRYLIQDYPVEFLSSANLMQFTKEKRRTTRDSVLAMGNPDLGDPAYNLRFAEREAKEVGRMYPHSAVYVEGEATKPKAISLSANRDILHFAVHAEFNEQDPMSSALLLAKDGQDDGRLKVSEIFSMNLKADLVVLSACETGLGKIRSGDEIIGMTRAFIYAGTPSVVTTLWKVNDRASYQLMKDFYSNLKTMRKSEALRQAQLKSIKEFPEPFFWAAYELTGEP